MTTSMRSAGWRGVEGRAAPGSSCVLLLFFGIDVVVGCGTLGLAVWPVGTIRSCELRWDIIPLEWVSPFLSRSSIRFV